MTLSEHIINDGLKTADTKPADMHEDLTKLGENIAHLLRRQTGQKNFTLKINAAYSPTEEIQDGYDTMIGICLYPQDPHTKEVSQTAWAAIKSFAADFNDDEYHGYHGRPRRDVLYSSGNKDERFAGCDKSYVMYQSMRDFVLILSQYANRKNIFKNTIEDTKADLKQVTHTGELSSNFRAKESTLPHSLIKLCQTIHPYTAEMLGIKRMGLAIADNQKSKATVTHISQAQNYLAKDCE